MPKLSDVGLTETPEAGFVPVPLSETVCGELGSLSATCRVADSAACVVGVKVTLIVQFAPPARVAGEAGQVFVRPKSPAFVPVVLRLLIVRAVVPLFVRVTVCAGLVVFSA